MDSRRLVTMCWILLMAAGLSVAPGGLEVAGGLLADSTTESEDEGLQPSPRFELQAAPKPGSAGEIVRLPTPIDDPSPAEDREKNRVASMEAPDDPGWWGKKYEQLNVSGAWGLTEGVRNVLVCIVDSGIDVHHEDLEDARYFGGKNFVAWDPSQPSTDSVGHGTQVAGMAVATTDNGYGIAGMAQVGYLSARVVGNQEIVGANVWTAVRWCADQGADVINMSFLVGGEGEGALQYAREKGALLVAATGNKGPCSDCVGYPASSPQVIAVAGTEPGMSAWEESRTGPEVELAAPADDLVTLRAGLPLPYVPPSMEGSSSHSSSRDLGTGDGTSFASPLVAGAAALVKSWAPGLSNEEIRGLLRATADSPDESGWSESFGYGVPNVGAALEAALPPDSVSPLLIEDFETGVPSNLETTGHWHVTDACQKGVGSSTYLGFHRQDACTYASPGGEDAAEPVRGEAILRVDLTEANGVSPENGALLEFSHRWDTEVWQETWRGTDEYLIEWAGAERPERVADLLKVQVRTVGSANWTTLDAWDARHPNQPDWVHYRESLDDYVGHVTEIRFLFDTVDPLDNDHGGWLIDDLRVSIVDERPAFP